MKNFFKKYGKYIILFFMFLFWNLIVQDINLDEIWNYGFSINMYKGLIPYNDFNMVITPFFNFLFSIPFHIFSTNILVFHIEQALLLTITSYLIFKLLDKKAWLVLTFFFIPMNITYPSYNFFCLFLTIFILYLEEKNSSKKIDLLIGLLIGLSILSKQSVGIFLILPSFFIKDKKRIIYRFVGMIIPNLIFLIYLLITSSLYKFIDCCFLGLFDFGNHNSDPTSHIYGIIFFIILLIINIYLIVKVRKDNSKLISCLYSLTFFTMMLPLFDGYHIQLSFTLFLIIILKIIKKEFLNYKFLFIVIYIFINIFMLCFYKKGKLIYPNDINNFQFRYINYENIKQTKEVNSYLNNHKNKKIIFLASNSYYFKIVNNLDINYLDLINHGNWGINESDKIIDEIKKNKDAIFLVQTYELKNKRAQINKDALKYVIKKGMKKNHVDNFDVYEQINP